MWHEARKQERMIRGLIVDYRRRAERRKDFYEKIKAEPTQFLQVHGRQCKIHLEPTVAAAGDSPVIMMPWQGDTSNLIDRFDVRAHLDYIPDVKHTDVRPEELDSEERQCNYERYRILAQNAFLGIGEEKFLRQLAVEEQFGVTIDEKEALKERLSERKGTGVAIGFNYNDPGAQPSSSTGPIVSQPSLEDQDSDDDSDLDIMDMDLSIDVNKMEPTQAHELNAVGPQFGMAGCDLFSYLTGDADDAEQQKLMLIEEKEKAMFSGRKSRRERRLQRFKKMPSRAVSPPAYAAPAPQTEAPLPPSRSPSRSPSPVAENIQFITSFGGEDEGKSPVPPKPLYADKLKENLKKPMKYSEALKNSNPRTLSSTIEKSAHRRRSWSSSSSRSPPPRRSPTPKRRLPISSRSQSTSPLRPRSVSRSRSISRFCSRSRSRSISPRRKRSRSLEGRGLSRPRSRSYSPRKRFRRSPSRRSRSRSGGYQRRSRSRSRSLSINGYSYAKRTGGGDYRANERRESPRKPSATQAPVRYYGRKKGEDGTSSAPSADSDSSEDIPDSQKTTQAMGNSHQNRLRSGSSSKGPKHETMTLKEKLKKKMQAQLSKQLRADKRAEAERVERESRRQARRDEEMRDLAIKLRRKQREMRHLRSLRSSGDSDGSRSRSQSHSPSIEEYNQEVKDNSDNKSKTRSPTPKERRIPVWTTTKAPDIYAQGSRNFEDSFHQNSQPRRYHEHSDSRQFKYPDDSAPPYDHRRRNFGEGRGYSDRREEGYRGEEYRREAGHSRHPYREPPRRFNREPRQEWQSRRDGDGETSGPYSKSKVKLVDY